MLRSSEFCQHIKTVSQNERRSISISLPKLPEKFIMYKRSKGCNAFYLFEEHIAKSSNKSLISDKSFFDMLLWLFEHQINEEDRIQSEQYDLSL